MLLPTSLLLILCSLTLADVSSKDVDQMKQELINLQNQLKYIKKSQLKNIENIVTKNVEEISKKKGTEYAEKCANTNGKRLLNDIKEKLDEATIGFIESCRNLLNMIEKHEMNQVELNQTKRMLLQQDGLFKQQINQTISAVNNYVMKKIWTFEQQISKQCY
uniref:Venom protein family 11 protein 1 n=1 Tax=Pristhesancus plagipennis TaxID=1955184 RepID=A0A2K8JWA5_PRIPG|nr:venom protein family 11 protein 1 [Pristhesancus plagipennis]